MRIYCKPGHKIVFAYPGNGYRSDQIDAEEYLLEGNVYTVAKTEVGAMHTNVWLKEVPGVAFNSVLFEDYREEECHDREEYEIEATRKN